VSVAERIERMPEAERHALLRRLAAKWHPPRLRYLPGGMTMSAKHELYLSLGQLEAFFGGAAGPGKSTALLAGALQYADVPGFSALILRRTYADLALPGALMDMAAEWLSQTDAHWRPGTFTWRFPSTATITFGHLEHEEQKRRYASSRYQYIAFDELTQFSETQYAFLFSRLRRPAAALLGRAPDAAHALGLEPGRARPWLGQAPPGGPGDAPRGRGLRPGAADREPAPRRRELHREPPARRAGRARAALARRLGRGRGGHALPRHRVDG
jgi:hypothetical protein